MTKDIGGAKFDFGDSMDPLEDFHGVFQTGNLPLGEVNLACVAGDNRLAVRAEAGEEHLHLGGCRVLRFVQDDESPFSSATAHVC